MVTDSMPRVPCPATAYAVDYVTVRYVCLCAICVRVCILVGYTARLVIVYVCGFACFGFG